ncbi:hypothetical protein SO802_018086 [Lithocarpus litseifolius]|uniref:Uncharacterized protein n=1 Tax=Lithocarpus litseifolius TaxID=425828 RepID=A0AAW2CK83_9ROSI
MHWVFGQEYEQGGSKDPKGFAINSGWRIHFNVEWYKAKERAAKVLAGVTVLTVSEVYDTVGVGCWDG